MLIVLRKMASGYDPAAPATAFWLVAAMLAVALLAIWRPVRKHESAVR